MILCEIDSNIIISEAMKNHTQGEMIRAYRVLMARLKAAGIKPTKHMFNNEAFADFKKEIKEHDMDDELVPKGMHRRNIAEKAIKMWKSNTVDALSGLPDSFPLFMWNELLPQLDMQVNLLRFSNVSPNVFSWTILAGAHDFNRHPLAPLGIKIHMLEQVDKRKSWGVKCKKGH